MSATLTTVDRIIEDMFCVVKEDELATEGFVHACGTPYQVRIHNSDGRCLRWVSGADAWEASIYLLCPRPECADADKSYIQGRLRINSSSVARLKVKTLKIPSFLQILREELDGLFDDFRTEISAATR